MDPSLRHPEHLLGMLSNFPSVSPRVLERVWELGESDVVVIRQASYRAIASCLPNRNTPNSAVENAAARLLATEELDTAARRVLNENAFAADCKNTSCDSNANRRAVSQ